ncbi:MAG: 3-deoxy-manno-octulosonate cytidylyltransferase [Victivallales bacterium]|nr:3-deoxy-manno-octulosonate cytidylyltransferase [Victivallales bacterium]
MSNKPHVSVFIPARYGSTRFPGKLLCELDGRPIIQWVHEKAAASSADDVWIATDDERIAEAVRAFGGKHVMTSGSHPSGTDRICEAARNLFPQPGPSDIVVNLQGDEPLLPTATIDRLIAIMLDNPDFEMSTVAVQVPRAFIQDNPDRVKVVLAAKSSRALYFTRAAAPFLRDGGTDCGMLLHWGIYAYRRKTLERLVSLPESPLEKCEKLEQLRAIEAGIPINVLITSEFTVGVDTPEDLDTVRKTLKKMELGRQRG